MKEIVLDNTRKGLIFSVVMVFLILIGFTTTLSEIFGNFLGLGSATMIGNTGGLMIVLVLIGVWSGLQSDEEHELKTNSYLLGGLAAGATVGLITGLFIFLIGSLDAADVNMRDYFVQLARPSVELVQFGRGPLSGALITLGLFTVGGLLGGALSYFQAARKEAGKTGDGIPGLILRVTETKSFDFIKNDPRGKWVMYGTLLLVLLIVPLTLSKYWNYAMGTVGIYVLMGLGLNIVVGLAGLLDLGYVAFFAIGAYTAGLLTAPAPITLQIGFWPALLLSVVFAAMAGILLGIPVLRMRGDYLAIVTLGFGEIIRVLIRSDMMSPYLGGPQGVRDIAGPRLFGYEMTSEQAYLYLIILGIILTIFLTNHVQNSRVGRAWMAMREDETVAQAMGINTLYYKLMAFATGAAFAGIGGALFAARNQYTGPADHSLMVSINVLCLLIVGGMGSVPGVIVGAFVLKGLPEILRELELFRLLVFGALLVIMMIWRPEGLWPAPRRKLELHEVDIGESPLDQNPDSAQQEGQAI